MGQKVHPLGFRLGVSQEHTSSWFAKNQKYSQFVIEDHLLRQSLLKRFPNAGISSIKIERELDTIKIHISSALPRPILGRFNKETESYSGLQDLRDELTKQIERYRFSHRYQETRYKGFKSKEAKERGFVDSSHKEAPQISVHITRLNDPDSSAPCLAEFLVEQLEKRIPFRRALKQTVQRAQKASVKGIKVQISGRLNGAEIARSERIHKGRVPLHTLRAKMGYTSRTARTIYGLLGVKVWVFQGDTTQ